MPGSSLTGHLLLPKHPPASRPLPLLLPQPLSLSSTSKWLDPSLLSGPLSNDTSSESPSAPTLWHFLLPASFFFRRPIQLNLMLSAYLVCLCYQFHMAESLFHSCYIPEPTMSPDSRCSMKTCDWPDALAPAYLLSKAPHHSTVSRSSNTAGKSTSLNIQLQVSGLLPMLISLPGMPFTHSTINHTNFYSSCKTQLNTANTVKSSPKPSHLRFLISAPCEHPTG